MTDYIFKAAFVGLSFQYKMIVFFFYTALRNLPLSTKCIAFYVKLKKLFR